MRPWPALRAAVSRLTVALALIAFFATSLAAPFGRVCLCLTGGVPVAVGSCCCDRPARDLCADARRPASRAPAPDATPPARGLSGAIPGSPATTAIHDDPCESPPCCPADDPSCIDLHASDEPSGSVAAAPARLPEPGAVDIVPPPPSSSSPDAIRRGRSRAVAWPVSPAASPPPRPHVLRC